MIDRGLRRADWRFLLPTPSSGCFNHLVLLGGDSEQAEMLLDAGIARRVTSEMAAPGAADAVVLLRRAKASLKDAARMLQSGGVFYAEVDRRLSGRRWLTPRTSERQLREAGLSSTGIYLVLPGFEAGRRYVPTDHPGLLDWYFRTLHSARTPLALIASAGLQFVTGPKHRRLRSVAPWYGITAVSASLPSPPPSVLGHPELPDSVRPPNARVLMVTNGQDDGSRVVILPFAWGGREPTGAVKVSRAAAFNGNTEREQAALLDIRQRLDDRLRGSIPEPLGLVKYAGLAVAVESCAPGAALTASRGRLGKGFTNSVQDLRLSIAWLVEFQRQTQSGSSSWTAEDAAHLDVRLEQYAGGLRLGAKTEELLRKTSACSRALIGAILPKVCLHNDFGPWNVYRQGDHITVIDWELGGKGTADRTGPALCDLIYFVTYWTLRARRLWTEAATLRGFRDLFIDPNKGGRASMAAHATIREYLVRSGIDPRFLPPILVYTWIERTLDQLARARAGGQAVLPASAEQYAQFVNLLAEHGERLFNDPLP